MIVFFHLIGNVFKKEHKRNKNFHAFLLNFKELQTPLHIASRLGNTDIVMLLLQHGAQVDAATRDSYTPLHIAAKEGQVNGLWDIFYNNFAIFFMFCDRKFVFFFKEEVAALLVDHKAPLAIQTKKGFTPLHLAAKYGNIDVAKMLLEKGANVDVEGKNQVTPLHVASHYNHENVKFFSHEFMFL